MSSPTDTSANATGAPASGFQHHTNIAAALEPMAAGAQGDARAFVVVRSKRDRDTRSVTFAELHDMVARCGGGLQRRGVGPGDRVVVFVPMSVELYVLLLAVFRIGAVAVFIDPWGGRRMIDAAAELAEPACFVGIGKAHLLRAASPALRRVPTSIVVGDGRLPLGRVLPGTGDYRDLLDVPRGLRVTTTTEVDAGDTALITFTTGSTDTPKGCNRTHGFLAAQHAVLSGHVDQGPGDVQLTNLPIVVLHNLGRGVTTLLPPRALAQDPQPDGTWLHGVAARHQATIIAVSPAPLNAITHSRDTTPLRAVRHVLTGGGPVLPDLLERALPFFPNGTITAMYGSTESEPIAHCDAGAVLERRQGVHEHGGIYVGVPVPETDVRLLRPTHGPVELPPGGSLDDWEVEDGAPGEVVVAGAHVNRDYYRNEDAFRENKIVDDAGRVWHRTGDMARRGADGGLWLLGRLNNSFRVDGQVVYPLEVETPLADLPQIGRAAACTPKFEGASREFKNASAVVAVEPASGYSRAEARNAALEYLRGIGYAASLEVRSLKKIPVDKRHATKVDMEALRKELMPKGPLEDY